jgi:hypothetical protein
VIPVAVVVGWIALVAPGVSRANRARYAADIAATAPNVMIGKAMVATAVVESDMREAIERCECTEKECDRDADGKAHAVGLYQLHSYHFAGHTADEICGSNRLASELAARWLRELVARTGDVEEALRVYVGTSVRRTDPRVKRRLDVLDQLMSVHSDV